MQNKLFLFVLLATLGGINSKGLTLVERKGCALGNTLISRRSYPMLGMNKCTWGPSYWCSHISKAKECGTLKHCASIWSERSVHANVCEVCEYFVNGTQLLKAHNTKHENIVNYLNTLCYQMPADSRPECHKVISSSLTEVLQLLDLGLNSRAVCISLDLCPQRKSLKSVEKTTTTPTTTTVAPATTTKKSNKVCHDCKVFFNDVRQRLRSNQTIKNVENLFDSTICVQLGPFREMCRQLIDAFVPMYLEDVSEFVDPGFLCSILSFCPESQRAAFFKALDQNQLNFAVKTSDAQECSNCKVFIKNIKSEIDSNTSVIELKKILEKDVCAHLGAYKSVCHMAVETYAQEILESILNNVDASVVCQKLGLCNGYAAMRLLVANLKTMKFSKSNPFEESTECELCKVLMSELHALISDKNVQTAVRDFINNEVCSRLENMKSACLTLVKEYEPLIMKAIEGLLDPNTSCARIGMCSNSSGSKTDVKSPLANTVPLSLLSPAAAAAFVPYQRVGLVLPPKTAIKTSKTEQCKICEIIMKQLEAILKKDYVQKDIEDALEEVCSLLPGKISTECADFIKEYTPGIIDLLLSEIQPDMVCAALGLCSGVSSPDSIGCSYCSEILGIASGQLASNPSMSMEEFEAMLLKLCTKYGEKYKDMCVPGVKQFGDTVYKALKSQMAPREVCGMIGFCASSAIKPETKHYLGVMCELLKSAGVTTECKEFTEITKDVNNHFLSVLLKTTPTKETNDMSSGMGCELCEDLIKYLKAFVQSDMSEDELKKELNIACGYLKPIKLAGECRKIINEYEDQIIRFLLDKVSAKEICEALSVCKSSNTLYYKPPHHNSCDLGIHYWCSSYTIAVKCKKIGVCSKLWKERKGFVAF